MIWNCNSGSFSANQGVVRLRQVLLMGLVCLIATKHVAAQQQDSARQQNPARQQDSAQSRSNGVENQAQPPRSPNVILILCDNLGYGDVGPFGGTRNRTPHLDNMAQQGMRLTSFYSTSGVCTPSRASLMTGCYPRRVNMHVSSDGGAVLRPVASRGLHPEEVTLAEVLKQRGYRTACIGKWHLGDQPQFLPTRQGFDHYFGIPYSDDMTQRPMRDWPPLPLMKDETVIEAPVARETLTRRYTQQAIRFIERNRQGPFFLYLPHAMPGSTKESFASEEFRGSSGNGTYGDAVQELDASTGAILAALRRLKLDDNTLVIWTSDNGAVNRAHGSNLPLSGWGYTTEEGAMRVPCIVRFPGHVPPGSSCDLVTTMMDWLPTLAHLAGGEVPANRNHADHNHDEDNDADLNNAEHKIDGRNIWPLLTGDERKRSPHEAFYYYQRDQLQAVRAGRWKLYLPLKAKQINLGDKTAMSEARLYDLRADLTEKNNRAQKQPAVVARLMQLAEQARDDLGDGDRPGRHQRPAGHEPNPRPLRMAE
jgi:arylsulfatase A-like enzyme